MAYPFFSLAKTKRVVPIVVIIYEAARAYDPPVKLKRESLHVVK
jgi:hypothetical protein